MKVPSKLGLYASFVVDGFSVFSLLRSLRGLDRRNPEELVDLALETSCIRPLQDRAEFLELVDLIAARDLKNVLEIGTFRGGTLFVFARLSQPHAILISVDLPGSVFGTLFRKIQEPLFKRFTRGEQRLLLLREDSHADQTRSKVALALKGPLDFLFIDGDHTYEGVTLDFQMYSPLVGKGGMVVFHDIVERSQSDYGVTRFWNETKARFKHREIYSSDSSKAMGIGVLWM
jgi:predicted O-methyltransferase YrrM